MALLAGRPVRTEYSVALESVLDKITKAMSRTRGESSFNCLESMGLNVRIH